MSGHVSMSKSGIKYVPVLEAVKSLADVNEKGNEEAFQRAWSVASTE